MNKEKTPRFAHTAIKIEDIVLDKEYALSINPEKQPNKNTIVDISIWYREIYDILLTFKDGLNITLYLEASPIGRYHFHGIIIIKDILTYLSFLNTTKKLWTYEIDTINDPIIFKTYMTKQKKIFENLLLNNIIGYPMQINSSKTFIQLNTKKHNKKYSWEVTE